MTLPDTPEGVALLLAQQEEIKQKMRWASWGNEQYTKCKNARIPFERQWYINLAFLAGKQYVQPIEITSAGFRLVTPKVPRHRVRLVINKIRMAVITECSKLTTSKPIPVVVPATNEDEDYSAAAVGEQILKSKFATASFESKYRLWVWWGVVCGNSFFKQYYDKDALDYEVKSVPKAVFPGTDTPLPDELIDQVKGLRELLDTPQPAKGKICHDVVNPFHLYVPDLLNEDINDQPYVIHVMAKSPLWVEKRYGFKPNTDSRASATVLDAATLIAKGAEDHLDAVLVKEIWIKPGGHEDFPEGGMITIINDRVVNHSPKWPYSFMDYPFYKFNAGVSGGFYCDSKIVDLIPVQKEYNKKRSQNLEIQNSMGKPTVFYQRGSLNPRKVSSEPGQMIEYVAGYDPPVPYPAAEVSSSMIQEIEKLQQEFDDISGQHEISRGTTSISNVTSATGIAYLQEQDDAKLNYPVSSIENATELLGGHYLHLASSYWMEDRLIHITGKNNQFEALHWRKGMLRGNTDVKVQTGSALPFSKAAKVALLTEWMQNGFIPPETGMEFLNLGGFEKILEDSFIDKRQAMRENLKMADIPESMLKLLLEPAPGPNGEPPSEVEVADPSTGQPIPVKINGDGTPFQPQPPIPANSWDNHEEHIHWHNHFRKTQQFELLSDYHKKAFELHIQSHQFALMGDQVNQQGQIVQQGQFGGSALMDDGSEPMEQGNEQPAGNEQPM